MTSRPPLSLYVHLPWCVRKCPYCDFNSHAVRGTVPEARYVDALRRDLDTEETVFEGRVVGSVFIGGGTPSLFSADAIGRILNGIRGRVVVAGDAEITLEANPGTFDAGRFEGFREAGVNRLSIGVQSFDDGLLRAIGRVHDAAEAHRALEGARAAGFENVNVDLMFGLPGQDAGLAVRDVLAATAHEPDHVSHYQLAIEPNTPFHRSPPALPDGDEVWRMQRRSHAELGRAGYRRYEVSAFARPRRRCAHNLNYWRFGDYVGIGAGAHSKWTCPHSGRVRRSVRHRHPRAYLRAASEGDPVRDVRELAPEDLVLEFTMNAIRLPDGFAESVFEARTGLPVDRLVAPLRRSIERGLVRRDRGRIRATALGMRFLDDVLLDLAPPSERRGIGVDGGASAIIERHSGGVE